MKNYRTFLNKDGAAMVYLVFRDGGKTIDLNITDCYRRVELDFGAYNKRQKKERLAKLAKLEHALKLIRQQLEGLNVPERQPEDWA